MTNLKDVMAAGDIAPKEAVRIVRAQFPSFDKTLLSKCAKPEKYGVVLHPEGFQALYAAFPAPDYEPPALEPDPEQPDTLEHPEEKRASERHRLRCRVSCRLEDIEYEALQRYVREDGFDTMQAWLSHKVRQYLKRKSVKEQST